MHLLTPFRIGMLVSIFFGSLAIAGEADLRTSIRGGCLDEANCCFGKWKMNSAANVYRADDVTEKVGTVLVGQEVEGVSGRVHTDPGKVKVVFNHSGWKKGDIVGLYSELDDHGKARIGTANDTKNEDFAFTVKDPKCAKPSKECWAVVLSQPKLKWWIKVKLPADQTGWIDSVSVDTDSECKL